MRNGGVVLFSGQHLVATVESAKRICNAIAGPVTLATHAARTLVARSAESMLQTKLPYEKLTSVHILARRISCCGEVSPSAGT